MKKRSFVFYIVFVVMLIVIPCVMIGCGGKEDVCKVSFELNNGQTIVPKYVEKGAVIKVDSPTKKDYTFGGWYTDANLQTQWDIDTHVVEDVMTLYAKWLAHPILTYDLVGGFCKESTSVVMQSTSGGTVTLIDKSKVEKPGFNFLGWSTTIDGSLCANSIEVKKNTTIYAKWQKKTSANTVTNMYYDVLAKLSELEYLAGEFKKTSNVSTSVENLTLNYIRGARYNTTQWNILAGSSNTAFERYVQENSSIQIANLQSIGEWEPVSGAGKIDFVHMMATLNMFTRSGGTMLLPDLGGWGGDLAQFAKELKDSKGTLATSALQTYANSTIASTSSTFGLADMNSDMDAVNIYRLMTECKYSIAKAFEVYYSTQVSTRKNMFKVMLLKDTNISTKNDFVEYIKTRLSSNYYIDRLLTDSYSLKYTGTDARYFTCAIQAFANYAY